MAARGPLSRSIFARARAALALEIERGTAFLLVPVLIAIGAMGYFSLDTEPGWLPVGAAALCAGGAAVCVTPGRAAWYAAASVLLVALGFLFAKVETHRASTQVIGGEISTRITGRVVSIDHLASGRIRLTIDVLSTQRPKLRYAPQRIRASARQIPPGLVAGSTIEGLVGLRPPPGPVRPGSYDFSFESYFDGIGGTGFFMSGPLLTEAPEAQAGVAAAIENARQRIAGRIRQAIGGTEGEIAAALMVGVRAGIDGDSSEALRRAGLYHVISISGLHMALVAGAVIGAMRALFALAPSWSARRPVRKYAAVGGLLAITAYLVISGGEVATQRSYLMLAVMLTALLFDRAALTMRNLAISAAIVLVMTPHEVVGPSFQMSFAATAALVGVYAWWTGHRKGPGTAMQASSGMATWLTGRAVAMVVGLALTSLVAGLATAAFGAYHFQRISPLSLFANLASMPVVSLVITPAALLAALLMPFGLDRLPLQAMGWGIGMMLDIAQWFAARSPLDAVGVVSGHAVVLLTVALTIATVATTRLRLVALPFAAAGMLLIGSVQPPDILIAEDGNLAGFQNVSGELAVSRARPNAFTVENWARALDASDIRKPVDSTAADGMDFEEIVAADVAPPEGFTCTGTTCSARHPSGGIIVQTMEEEDARRACGFASAIILGDATSRLRCADPHVALITARQLARYGSAAVSLGTEMPLVEFSATSTGRPWHDHRRFSRAARGMAPYKREAKPASQSAPTSPPATGENKPGDARSTPGDVMPADASSNPQ